MSTDNPVREDGNPRNIEGKNPKVRSGKGGRGQFEGRSKRQMRNMKHRGERFNKRGLG